MLKKDSLSTSQVNSGNFRAIQPLVLADCTHRCATRGGSTCHTPVGEMYRIQWPNHSAATCFHLAGSLSGKTQGIWKFCQNTGNLVCSSCKFPDSKSKRYFAICRENSQICFEAGDVYQGSLVYVIVTNHVNWHRKNLQSDREKTGKTGNLKKKFEWVPCLNAHFLLDPYTRRVGPNRERAYIEQ